MRTRRPSKRYTVVVADGDTAVVRRFSVRLRPAVLTVSVVLALPVLIGMGARWSAMAEITRLETLSGALEIENASYRAATGELTTQITSLQDVVADLGARTSLDPVSAKAVEKLLTTLVKSNARGGVGTAASLLATPTIASPESTFGLLRELLGRLESKLQIVRTDVERREAFAAATPSIWPAHGWLAATFGRRADPFTGQPDFHPGLDISTDKGRPVYATADGWIRFAAYSGAYGNLIVIDHGFGLQTKYGHLSGYAVRAGRRVTRGDIIGYVGATGRATGAHVHYEVWANGRQINPLQLLISQPPAG